MSVAVCDSAGSRDRGEVWLCGRGLQLVAHRRHSLRQSEDGTSAHTALPGCRESNELRQALRVKLRRGHRGRSDHNRIPRRGQDVYRKVSLGTHVSGVEWRTVGEIRPMCKC